MPETAQRSQCEFALQADLSIGYVNSIKLRLRLIPPGEFVMGSPANEEGRCDDEAQYRVRLTRGFYTGVTPVTQGQWQAVMGTTVAQQRDKGDPSRSLFGKGANHPMYYVNWEEARAFCEHLTEWENAAGPAAVRTVGGVRLPSSRC